MKVYVVTSGCYSDYSIVGVFTKRALARRYVDAHGGDSGDNRIEVYETDPDGAWARPGMFAYRVRMDAAGNTVGGGIDYGCGPSGVWESSDEILPRDQGVADIYHARHNGECGEYCHRIVAHVYASDPRHAVKIVNEWRAATIAVGFWDGIDPGGWRRVMMGPPMAVIQPRGLARGR